MSGLRSETKIALFSANLHTRPRFKPCTARLPWSLYQPYKAGIVSRCDLFNSRL